MSIIRIIIVEDERPARDLVKTYLEAFPEMEVIGEYDNGFDGLKAINEQKPDAIFLDVQMPKLTGFEMLEVLEHQPEIIFTTAYDSYAIKAFELNSLDYLLKPIDEKSVGKALQKFKQIYEKSDPHEQNLHTIFNQFLNNYKSRFFVKLGTHFHSIAVDDIQCFLIVERGIFLRSNSGKKYSLDYSLDQIQKLVDPSIFFRINRNYLIHIDSIQDIYSYSSNRLGVKLKMLDHLDMIVSREKVMDFKNWLRFRFMV